MRLVWDLKGFTPIPHEISALMNVPIMVSLVYKAKIKELAVWNGKLQIRQTRMIKQADKDMACNNYQNFRW